jgi:hypothetical protein
MSAHSDKALAEKGKKQVAAFGLFYAGGGVPGQFFLQLRNKRKKRLDCGTKPFSWRNIAGLHEILPSPGVQCGFIFAAAQYAGKPLLRLSKRQTAAFFPRKRGTAKKMAAVGKNKQL